MNMRGAHRGTDPPLAAAVPALDLFDGGAAMVEEGATGALNMDCETLQRLIDNDGQFHGSRVMMTHTIILDTTCVIIIHHSVFSAFPI